MCYQFVGVSVPGRLGCVYFSMRGKGCVFGCLEPTGC